MCDAGKEWVKTANNYHFVLGKPSPLNHSLQTFDKWPPPISTATEFAYDTLSSDSECLGIIGVDSWVL
jgi:hypothetical protein